MLDMVATELTQKFHRSIKKDFELFILNPVLATQLTHQQLGIALDLYLFCADLQQRFEPH